MQETDHIDKTHGQSRRVMPGFIFSFALIVVLFVFIPAYRNAATQFIFGPLSTIVYHPQLSREQKLVLKLGFDYTYVHHIKTHTPEHAVILMPDSCAIYPDSLQSEFTSGAGGIKNKAWASYFLYPRRLVYSSEIQNDSLDQNIDYIAIVNFRGYDLLPYSPAQKVKHGIFPINPESTPR